MSSRSRSSAAVFPDHVELLCGEQALAFEDLRQAMLKLFLSRNFELVMPPMLERAEQLPRQQDGDLRDMMFAALDPVGGGTVYVRADVTAQTAFLDACCARYQKDEPARMCYALPALHASPRHILSTREPWYAGVELYGSSDMEADMEILLLMVECMRLAVDEPLHVGLGHAAIYPALTGAAKLSPVLCDELLPLIERKSSEDILAMTQGLPVNRYTDMLRALAELHGGRDTLAEAKRIFKGAPPEVAVAMSELEKMADAVEAISGDVHLRIDLGDLAGFRYHTGLVFAVYAAGCGEALAHGGRCDGLGASFGRARPAVGFSTDLRLLVAVARARS